MKKCKVEFRFKNGEIYTSTVLNDYEADKSLLQQILQTTPGKSSGYYGITLDNGNFILVSDKVMREAIIIFKEIK